MGNILNAAKARGVPRGTEFSPLAPLGRIPASGDFLLLIEPGRVPPHLAWVRDGRYYALSVKGVECDKELEGILRALDRKGKEALILPVSPTERESSLEQTFCEYEGAGPPENSCLAPIRDLCGVRSEADAPTVHELVALLHANGRLRPPFLLHTSGPLPERFILPAYGKADVEAHIRNYQDPMSDERG